MDRKYKLTDITLKCFGKILYRIQALKDFSDVKKGDFGGYVHGYYNLSQKGNCWIYDNSLVLDNALVENDARVKGNSIVRGNATVQDCTIIQRYAIVRGASLIKDSSVVSDNAEVNGNVIVCKNANITSHAYLKGDVVIKDSNDYVVFKNTWSSGRYFTYIFSCKMWTVGCFYGTGEELIEKAYKDSELSGKMYSLYVRLVEDMEKVRNGR